MKIHLSKSIFGDAGTLKQNQPMGESGVENPGVTGLDIQLANMWKKMMSQSRSPGPAVIGTPLYPASAAVDLVQQVQRECSSLDHGSDLGIAALQLS